MDPEKSSEFIFTLGGSAEVVDEAATDAVANRTCTEKLIICLVGWTSFATEVNFLLSRDSERAIFFFSQNYVVFFHPILS